MKKQRFVTIVVSLVASATALAVLLTSFGGLRLPPVTALEPGPTAPESAAAASPWCVAGGFQGWNNASHPLYDDGTHGDLIPDDGVLSAEYTIATADRYEWKAVTCGDWSTTHPSDNSWLYTTVASQTVRFTLDTNTYSDGWLPATNIVNANDNLSDWTAVGDWQGWDNANPATVMTDIGFGRYFLAYAVPTAGSHEYKAVRTGSWDALGADNRSINADTVSFDTTADNQTVYFLTDLATGRVRVYVPGTPPASPWYVRGDFNGWGTTDPLYDDGTHGDLAPDDGIFSAVITVTTPGRSEWKVATDDWSQNYPSQNSWISTTVASQTVRFSLDTNTYSDGWLPTTNIVNANDDVGASFSAVGDFNGWDNADPTTLMTGVGYGRYYLAYTIPAAGTYNGKVTRTGTWDAFGADGRSKDAQNVEFTTAAPNQTVYFLLNVSSGRLQIVAPVSPAHDNYVMPDGLEHDSRDDFYRIPFGAVPTSTLVTLRFRTYADDVTGVKVRVWDTALASPTVYPMTKVTTIPGDEFDYDVWELELTAPDYLTILYYRFIVADGTDVDYYEDDDLFDGALGQPYDESPDNSWQIDVYDPAFDTPDWFKDAVVYQIFPDRFRNGVGGNDPISGTFFYDEDPGVLTAHQWNWIVPDPRVSGPWEGSYSKLFYGGDLQGIVDKLDYLQALGVDTLYLNPIFESPSNHKYDATNYEEIDDNFGDLTTFLTLTTELENRDMHLILDGVFNHSSSDSCYFDRYGRYPQVGACEAVTSTYRDWYYFTPADPPGSGVCAGDTNYQAWWGFESLPKLNTTDNEDVRDYIYRTVPPVATYWLDQGADGWRLDVASDVHPSFWQEWRAYIRDANPDAITIAEDWGDASRFMLGDQLDSTMNYRFRNGVIGLLRETDWQDTNSTIKALSVSQFDSVMHGIEEDYPPEAWYALMNLVGSHDVNRVLIPLDQDGDPTDADYSDGKARLRVLAIIQMTMPGAPTVYYGDEVGLVGYGDPAGGGVYYSDPYNRQPYPWPDEPGYGDLPAWRQQDLTLHTHYSATAAIRNGNPALRTGSFDTLLTDDDNDLYAYGRKLGDDAAVIAVNMGTTTQTVTIGVKGYLPEGITLTDKLNGGTYTVTGREIVVPDVAPMWGAILTVDAGQDLTPPDAPVNLAATEGDGQVNLTWDAVTGANDYTVFRSYVSGGGYSALERITDTTYLDDSVTNGTYYYYVVVAADASGNESGYSNEAAALPHATIGWAGNLEPDAITHTIGITPTGPISAQVWIDGVTNAPGQGEGVMAELGFGVSGTLTSTWETWVAMDYVADVGNNDQYAATLTPEVTGTMQYLVRFSTTRGREWTYAYTSGDQRGVLTVQPSSDTTPPGTPSNLRVTDWSADWVALAWDPIIGDLTIYAHDVFRSEVSGTVGTRIGRVLASNTIYTDTGLSVGQTYYYVIQAVDTSFNKSGYSNQVEATPQAKVVEVRFYVTVPTYTPAGDTVYIAGDNEDAFNGWWDSNAQPMTQQSATQWMYTTTVGDGTALQYKYTRGSWDVVENWGDLVGTINRETTISYGATGVMTITDTVYNWRDALVVETYPEHGAQTWDVTRPISVTFNRPIDTSLVDFTVYTLTGFFDGTVYSGTFAFDQAAVGDYDHPDLGTGIITGTVVLFTPTMPLTTTTAYQVTLAREGYNANTDDGTTMQADYVWNFGVRQIYLPLVMRDY